MLPNPKRPRLENGFLTDINFGPIQEIFKFWEIPPREMFRRALIGQAPRMSHRVTH